MLFALPSPMLRLLGAAPAARPRVKRLYAAHVRAGATREIVVPPGQATVHCREGEAWITHDGDPRDVMLRADQSYAMDQRRAMRVHALRGDCVLEIVVED